MFNIRKSILALTLLGATVLPLVSAPLTRPAKADDAAGAAILGGILGYGLYSANKHHREDDRRNRGYYGRGEREHHEGRNRYNRYDSRDNYRYGGGYGDPHHNGYSNRSRYDHRGYGGYYGSNNGYWGNGPHHR